MVVLDIKTDEILAAMTANGVHGIALAPDLKRGFFSNGGDNTVTIFDLTHWKILGTVPTGQGPDAICYDPITHRVFAFDGKSNTTTVIDAVEEKVVGEIPLEGRPEFAVADGNGSLFNALEDKSQIVKINARTMKIEKRWNLPPGCGPSGLAIDAKNQRLFIGCGNKTMIVLDATDGKVVATLPIGQGVDACVFDPIGQRAFASCGDGTMTVVQQTGRDTYSVAEMVTTQPRARTMAFDPATGLAYLPIAKFGPPPAPTPDHPKPRPSILPNSLEILVVGAKP